MGKQAVRIPGCGGVTSPVRTDLQTCIPRALRHAGPSSCSTPDSRRPHSLLASGSVCSGLSGDQEHE